MWNVCEDFVCKQLEWTRKFVSAEKIVISFTQRSWPQPSQRSGVIELKNQGANYLIYLSWAEPNAAHLCKNWKKKKMSAPSLTHTPLCFDKCQLTDLSMRLHQILREFISWLKRDWAQSYVCPILEQWELLPVGLGLSDLFIWPLSMRLMYPITSGHSLFRSCSPAAKWMIKLEGVRGGSLLSRVFYGSGGATHLSFFYLSCKASEIKLHLSNISISTIWFSLVIFTTEVSVYMLCVCYCLSVRGREQRKTSSTKKKKSQQSWEIICNCQVYFNEVICFK